MSLTTAEVLKSFDLGRHSTIQWDMKKAATVFSEASEILINIRVTLKWLSHSDTNRSLHFLEILIITASLLIQILKIFTANTYFFSL